jgi:putative addiction module component (TIGR02574 family)
VRSSFERAIEFRKPASLNLSRGWPRCTTSLPGARLSCMNARVDHLLHEALELPDEERSALVVALLDSLEGSADPSISEAWREEVRTRRNALRDGSIQTTSWAEAKARLSAL